MEYIVRISVEFLAKWWHRWLVPFLVSSVIVIVGGLYFTKLGSVLPPPAAYMLVPAACVLFSLAWWLSNRLPKTPRGKVGIVLSVYGETSEDESRARRDLAETLRSQLGEDAEGRQFHIIVLSPRRARLQVDEAAARATLAAVRGHFMLWGDLRLRKEGGEDVYQLACRCFVRHAPLTPVGQAALSDDFPLAMPKEIPLRKKDEALVFKATAHALELGCRYIIGLAALYSGDVRYAERLLLAVEAELKTTKVTSKSVRKALGRLPEHLARMYGAWQDHRMEQWYLKRNEEDLRASVELARRLVVYHPGAISALEVFAMGSFWFERDVQAAFGYYAKCRKSTRSSWRFGVAFLHGYQGDLASARRRYEEAAAAALRDATIPLQTEEFIHLVLEREPEKGQLHYCLGCLNELLKGDEASARESYARFVAWPGSASFPTARGDAEKYLRRP